MQGEHGTLDLLQPLSEHPLNTGLVSRYQALDGIYWGGPKYYDLAGRNHPALTNSPTWGGALGRPGGFGRLALDGTDDYATIAVNNSLKPATLTLAGWFRATSWGAYKQLVGASSTNFGSGYGFVNGVNDNGSLLGFWVNFYTTAAGGVASVTVPSTDTWFHALGTYDLANARIYINGIEQNSMAFSTAVNYASVNNFLIGAGNDGGAYWFPGSTDDVRLWSRALSASEAWAVYEDSLRGCPLTLNWLQPRVAVAQAAAATTFSQIWWNSAYDYSGIGV